MNAQPGRVAELLACDVATGIVTRRVAVGNRKAGEEIRTETGDGYYRVGIDGRDYLLHRVVWCLYFGAWPTGVLDHINGDGRDNRIANLRDVDQTINLLNQKKRRASASGIAGVDRLPSGKHRARLKAARRRVGAHLGTFVTAEAASAAYEQAKRAVLDGDG